MRSLATGPNWEMTFQFRRPRNCSRSKLPGMMETPVLPSVGLAAVETPIRQMANDIQTPTGRMSSIKIWTTPNIIHLRKPFCRGG